LGRRARHPPESVRSPPAALSHGGPRAVHDRRDRRGHAPRGGVLPAPRRERAGRERGEGARRGQDERADLLPEHEGGKCALGSRADASGGYRIILEFYLETPEALDAKYTELTGFGYVGHCAPYDVTPELRFAMVDDPDGNTILLSAFESQSQA
jgi:hypothetical protein